MKSAYSKEEKFLIQSDTVLSKVIKNNGHISFSNKKTDPFDALVGIIISQFISAEAARSIKIKILNKFNTKNFEINDLKNLNIKQIKDLGVSLNKAKSIKAVTGWVEDQSSFETFFDLDQDARRKELLKIFGIGPWSVDMFEMFCIRNRNIFSYGDAALREAMIQLKMINKSASKIQYENYATKWSPYKTVACLHLWQMIES
tara:strand:+ start:39 stop:644 length:606 start_codon:yes stop_codon:yes gene_type:complete